MTQPVQDPSNPAPRFCAAFAALLPEIRAVPESDFAAINIDVPSSVTTALGAWPEIRALRDQVAKDVSSFDITLLDKLESYALALGHAQTEYQTAMEPNPSLVALANENIKWRTILLNDVTTLISRGILPEAITSDLKGINGHKNIAFDLFALANVIKKNWDKVSNKTTVTQDELVQAQNLADKLVTAVGEREQAPMVEAEAVRDRQAAFTLFINAYDEVRSVISYLRRKQGDADSIIPSLYAGRTATKKKPTDNGTDNPPAPNPAPPTTTPPNNGGTNPTLPAKADMSGDGPFMH
jgi:hypothetical protein